MPLVIFQLKLRMDNRTSISMPNKMAMEQTIPADDTETGFRNTQENINQGNGNLL